MGPYQFQRREVRPHDVLIDIWFCGVCHSDLHQVRDEWGAEGNIMSDVEVIPMSEINNAYERMLKGDVHYRFVIDMGRF